MSSEPPPAADRELDVPPMDRQAPSDTVYAAFALGCFWGPDALFGALDGVVRTCVGYAGGTTETPTYADIGDHIETVRVEFDPDQMGYADLLHHFWENHDPRRAPFKRQYQSALFPRTDEQAEQARASKAKLEDRYDGGVSTEVIPDATFSRAEAYHQKYKLRRREPLMRAFSKMYPEEEAFADSPAAALVNGYVGGHRSPDRLEDDLPRLGLPSETADELRRIVKKRHS